MTFRGSPVKAFRIGTGPILALLIALSLAGCFLESPDGGGIEGHAARPTVSTPSTTGKALAARPGVSDTTILFGQSAAFSGPAQELGRNMRLGIEAAFHEVNQRGGVHGRRLLLSYKDDGYEPQAAIDNTKDLIRKGNIFALIGAVGTPTSRSAAPVAADAGVPYIAPFTGAGLLREAGFLEKEQLEKIINLRASYKQETEEMVARLTTDLGIKRIAVMYQDDSYGRAGYVGVIEALKRRGMEPRQHRVVPAKHHGRQDRSVGPKRRVSRSGHCHRRISTRGFAGLLGALYGHEASVYDPFIRRQQRARRTIGIDSVQLLYAHALRFLNVHVLLLPSTVVLWSLDVEVFMLCNCSMLMLYNF